MPLEFGPDWDKPVVGAKLVKQELQKLLDHAENIPTKEVQVLNPDLISGGPIIIEQTPKQP